MGGGTQFADPLRELQEQLLAGLYSIRDGIFEGLKALDEENKAGGGVGNAGAEEKKGDEEEEDEEEEGDLALRLEKKKVAELKTENMKLRYRINILLRSLEAAEQPK